MLGYITTYGLMLFCYSLFFIAVITGFKNSSGQLKDILSGKADPGILFTRLISGIFFLAFGTVALFAKTNIDVDIFTLAWGDYNATVWIVIAAAIIIGTLSAFKKIYPANNS